MVKLKALGSGNAGFKGKDMFSAPNPKLLEKFANPFSTHSRVRGSVDITTSEFSSLCPLTGQPDWATIVVTYTPNKWCVESKSFKLYLAGFRNHGEFHEACVNRIGEDLRKLLSPVTLFVRGEFTARGGIAFHPTYSYHA